VTCPAPEHDGSIDSASHTTLKPNLECIGRTAYDDDRLFAQVFDEGLVLARGGTSQITTFASTTRWTGVGSVASEDLKVQSLTYETAGPEQLGIAASWQRRLSVAVLLKDEK
jgi:hypothetical protein